MLDRNLRDLAPQAALGLVLLLFCFIYLEPLNREFAFHNDYSYLTYDTSQNLFSGYPETGHLINIGRPLGAVLLNVHAYLLGLKNFSNFGVARSLSLLLTLLSIWLFWHTMVAGMNVKSHKEKISLLLLSSICFSLPSIALYNLWITNFVPGTLNIFLALWAWEINRKSTVTSHRYQALVLRSSAFLLLAGCFFIYPPTAFSFFLPTAIVCIWRIKGLIPATKQLVLSSFLLLLGSMVTLGLALSILKRSLEDMGGDYKISATNAFLTKFNFLVTTFFPKIFSFWFVEQNSPGRFLMTLFVFLVATRGIYFIRENRRLKEFYLELTVLVLGSVLVISPFVVPQANVSFYRTLFPTMPLAFILIYSLLSFKVSFVRNSAPIALSLVLICGLFYNRSLVSKISMDATNELRSIFNILQKTEVGDYGIAIVQDASPCRYSDDLCLDATSPLGTNPGFFIYLERSTGNKFSFRTVVERKNAEMTWAPNGTKVFLKNGKTKTISEGDDKILGGKLSTTTNPRSNGPGEMFDDNRRTFFEFSGVAPQTLRFEPNSNLKIFSYQVCVDEFALERAPRAWLYKDSQGRTAKVTKAVWSFGECFDVPIYTKLNLSWIELTFTPASDQGLLRIADLKIYGSDQKSY